MKAIVTGASGTVGQALCAHLERTGWTVVRWDRARVPVDDYGAIEGFLAEERPEVVFHLAIASQSTGAPNEGWRVNWLWPSELAWACRQLGVKFVQTSTALVFTDRAQGPFTPDSLPDARDGYGGEKAKVERRIRSQNPNATILRIGWQIGRAPWGNNLLEFLERQMKAHGEVRASTRWLPACAFLEDTAQGFVRAVDLPPGTYHLDSNRGWSFFEIARALSKQHGEAWKIVPTEDFVHDQRLLDDRLQLPPLSDRLPL